METQLSLCSNHDQVSDAANGDRVQCPMLPEKYFRFSIHPHEDGFLVEVTHCGTASTLSRECDFAEVSKTKAELCDALVMNTLGRPEDVVISFARADGGELVWAEHIPTGIRTKSHRRRELDGDDMMVVEELIRLMTGHRQSTSSNGE